MTTRRRILTGASVGLFLLWAAIAATASAQWQRINEDGFGAANVDSVASLAMYGGHLYAGTASPGGAVPRKGRGRALRLGGTELADPLRAA